MLCLISQQTRTPCIERVDQLLTARQLAEELAEFADLAMIDRTLDSEVVREAGTLDDSLRERRGRDGARPQIPPPPLDASVTVRAEGDGLLLALPPLASRARRGVFWRLMVAVVLVGGLLGSVPVMVAWDVHPVLGVLVGAGISAVVAAIPFIRVSIVVSPEELRVERRWLSHTRIMVMATSELEELAIVSAGKTGDGSTHVTMFGEDAPVVMARSDRASICFGAGLERGEIEWLRAVVESIVTASGEESHGTTKERV
ncbi:hypothetical protein HQ576_19470 [bacterium]|nr:hypothetical protein [bacterium]